ISYTGEVDLRPLSNFDELHVLPQLPPQVIANLRPITAYQSKTRLNASALLIIDGSLLAFSLWQIAAAALCVFNPTAHPVCKALKRFGKPEEIAVAVNAEMG